MASQGLHPLARICPWLMSFGPPGQERPLVGWRGEASGQIIFYLQNLTCVEWVLKLKDSSGAAPGRAIRGAIVRHVAANR